MKLSPGDKISYTVSYLQMSAAPAFDWPRQPSPDISVVVSKNPPTWYFFNLYAAVGSNYEWTDKYKLPRNEVDDFLSDLNVRLFTLFKNGWTAGFFVLDKRKVGICDLAYFGLVPEVIGYGYGDYLLKYAVKESWREKDVEFLTVNTNTLDHHNALPLYKKMGFELVNSQEETRILTKSRIINSNQN